MTVHAAWTKHGARGVPSIPPSSTQTPDGGNSSETVSAGRPSGRSKWVRCRSMDEKGKRAQDVQCPVAWPCPVHGCKCSGCRPTLPNPGSSPLAPSRAPSSPPEELTDSNSNSQPDTSVETGSQGTLVLRFGPTGGTTARSTALVRDTHDLPRYQDDGREITGADKVISM
ncbi:hypothetical protein BO71DRAFT_434824 [Aspergillus ellipticus CBS 707.79]|uniref:Uncharacterized protein n=1 Tax=Aspergillus ellipticus CBS 707.79 TaxID=1448320 RepID=A0A319CVU2_9EURO|nr:hypothetical protein BO71DRAFT_434824 [Aspergillus ellipticus CBS 707.79]